ncbi:large subunit aromatic oxygenase [Pseudomonas putida]|uniref:Large subunit aromatic oxygenase n=1 Tax=Pseudomonas putida (strain DOT-T1E) TaxID=1196325 RepID=I7AXX8_PSEPT|nr:large subunit aromatic oxygenase [Pseudomonas putida]AFO47550.1 large subunit aromatic oxygenase [Pseudomonas putida DOT-T1E]
MSDGFDKSAYSLKPVSYGEIHGLMFICLCDEPPSLESAIRDLEEPMALFDFPNLKVAANKTYDIPANWKLGVEVSLNCTYHGWAFGNDGELLGIHNEHIYEGDIDKAEWGLREARVSNYKGLNFANFDTEAPELETWLGDYRWYLDMLLDNEEGASSFYPALSNPTSTPTGSSESRFSGYDTAPITGGAITWMAGSTRRPTCPIASKHPTSNSRASMPKSSRAWCISTLRIGRRLSTRFVRE